MPSTIYMYTLKKNLLSRVYYHPDLTNCRRTLCGSNFGCNKTSLQLYLPVVIQTVRTLLACLSEGQ